MGEYHTIRHADGSSEQLCKVGTMDDWRYVRRSEVERMALVDTGENTNMHMALKDAGLLYRFPWPDEDAHEHDVEHIDRRDMFRTYTVPVSQQVLRAFTHKGLWISNGAANQGGAWNVNIKLPCPLAPDFALPNSGTSTIIQVIGERYAQGVGRTIFGCAYCEALFSLDTGAELEAVRTAFNTWRRIAEDSAWYRAVAARLRPRP